MKLTFGLPTVLSIIISVTGAVVVITNPGTLSFHDYLRDLVIAWGLLGIGHGIDATSKP